MNMSKALCFAVLCVCLWCAKNDSRPLEKANDPMGNAESERRRRAWRADGVG